MTEPKKDPMVQYSPEEEAALERHERIGFGVTCRVSNCPECGGPEAQPVRETPEASADAGETPEGSES